MTHESRLHRVEVVTVRQAFDGGDVVVGVHHREREAAVDALPVDDHCAGAALPVIASLLGAGEREMLTQRVEQCGARIERQMFAATVDLKSDGHAVLRRLAPVPAPNASCAGSINDSAAATAPVSSTVRRVT